MAELNKRQDTLNTIYSQLQNQHKRETFRSREWLFSFILIFWINFLEINNFWIIRSFLIFKQNF